MMLTPGTAGDVLKTNVIERSPFSKKTLSAGVPFTVKSLESRVAGSTGSLTSRMKSVGGVVTTLSQPAVLTEQGVAVGVGVGVPARDGSLSKKASCCDVLLMATRPSIHEVTCLVTVAEP